jgi:predicted Ser/Thr protein kinase
MPSRSGSFKAVPEVFAIKPLDVVIHYDRMLGEGRFGQVYEAKWQGITVAVKLFNRSVLRSVCSSNADQERCSPYPRICSER